jgi:hypothetical protein
LFPISSVTCISIGNMFSPLSLIPIKSMSYRMLWNDMASF